MTAKFTLNGNTIHEEIYSSLEMCPKMGQTITIGGYHYKIVSATPFTELVVYILKESD